jgi:hypothetical protein
VANPRAGRRSKEGRPYTFSFYFLHVTPTRNARPGATVTSVGGARSAGLNPAVERVFDDGVPLGLTDVAGDPEIELIRGRDDELIPVVVEFG